MAKRGAREGVGDGEGSTKQVLRVAEPFWRWTPLCSQPPVTESGAVPGV